MYFTDNQFFGMLYPSISPSFKVPNKQYYEIFSTNILP